jgi:hypothetical protein
VDDSEHAQELRQAAADSWASETLANGLHQDEQHTQTP